MIANWARLEFGSIAKLSKNRFHPKKSSEDKKCIELEHIQKKTGCLLGFISSRDQLSTKNIFSKGNILFGKLRPNLRKYFYCDFDGVCSSEIWVLIPQKEVYPKYLFYLVQQEKFIQTACVTSGSKMPRADWQHVSQTPFNMPSVPKQKAIASLLEKWDIAIEKTEALIAAKQKQFRWLVKTLIQQKQYINGWQEVKLGEVGNFSKGHGVSKSELVKNGVPCIHYGELYTKHDIKVKEFYSFIENKNLDNYTRIKNNSLLFASASNTRKRIGDCASFNHDIEVYAGDAVIILSIDPANLNAEFASFYLNTVKSKKEINRLGQGSPIMNIYSRFLQNIKIPCPPISEQNAIVKILNTAEREIILLEQLAERYQVQKRGLMNKLLTGEWRISA